MKTDVEFLEKAESGVIVSTNTSEHAKYVAQRRLHEKNNNEINTLRSEISELHGKMNNIMVLLEKLTKDKQ